MSVLLQVDDLKIWFANHSDNANPTDSVKAVDGISFTISRNETYALLGESGSGKTITALAISQLLQDAKFTKISGKILFEGVDLLKQPEAFLQTIRGNKIGFIFQEPMSALNPVLTIRQQLIETAKRSDKLSDLLISVGLNNSEHILRQYPHELSGGMRQRVMIAMALAPEPDLLIADEPTTALDVTTQAQILSLIQSIQKTHQTAILFITHDLSVASNLADRIGIAYQGKIIEEAVPEVLLKNPKHPYTLQLLNALPSFEKRGKMLGGDRPIATLKNQNNHNDTLLSVHNIGVYFPIKQGIFKRKVGDIKAVQNINFALKSGKTLALVGESGCGKSTLAKALVGLNSDYRGDIFYRDKLMDLKNPATLRQWRTKIQIIFQDPYSSINPRMMIKDVVAEGAVSFGLWQSDLAEKVTELLKKVGLDEAILYRYPHEFSGGQRQRIVIARALAIQPEILICDEPTSALDVSVQAQVLNLLKSLQQESQLSYLFITHNLHAVAWLADEIAVMYQGKIVEFGTTEQIIKAPQHDYTKMLLNALPEAKYSA